MTLYAFDGAGPFDLAAAKAHGGIVATTYIRGTPGGLRPADVARVAEIRANGLGASPNWEAAPDFFGTCSVADAQWAGADALLHNRALGYPDDGSIRTSFSFDFDVPAGRYPEMGSKVLAITAGLGGHYQTMIYGQMSLIVYLNEHGFTTGRHWLMMSTFGQPYDPSNKNVCIIQGHDVAGNWIQGQAIPGTDINTVTAPHAVGAWWPDNSPYKGADMPLTDADAAVFWGHKIGDDVGTAGQALHDARQIAATARDNAAAAGATAANAVRAAAALAAQVATLTAAVKALQGGPVPAGSAPSYEGTVTLTPRQTP